MLDVVEDVTKSLIREQRQSLHEVRQHREELLALVSLDNVLHDVVAVLEVDAQRLNSLRLVPDRLGQLALECGLEVRDPHVAATGSHLVHDPRVNELGSD